VTKSIRTLVPVGVILCALGARAEAADGIQLVQKTTSGTTVTTSQMQADKTHLRTEIADASGAKQIVIFDGGKETLYMINMERKTYTEMTKADLDRMAGQMQDTMSMMQAQMANLPPAQRAQMEAMMRGRGMPGMAAPAKTEYKRNGTDRVGRWTCDKYDGYQNGEKTSELCTVPPTALGIGGADLDVTRQMAEFFRKLMPQAADQIASVGRVEDQGFSGFPIRRISTTMGRTTTTEVTEAGRANIPDAVFALPAGLTRQESPMAGMGGRGRGR